MLLNYVLTDDTRPISLMNVSYKFVATMCNGYLVDALLEYLDERRKVLLKRPDGHSPVTPLYTDDLAVSRKRSDFLPPSL